MKEQKQLHVVGWLHLIKTVQTTLNQRPISYKNGEVILTRNDLLGIRRELPLEFSQHDHPNYSSLKDYGTHLLDIRRAVDSFWSKYHAIYLQELMMSHGRRIRDSEDVDLSDIVGIKDLTNHVGNYSIAEVVGIFPSSDGASRILRLRTSRGHSKNHPLPIDSPSTTEKIFIRHASATFIILKYFERDHLPIDPVLLKIQLEEDRINGKALPLPQASEAKRLPPSEVTETQAKDFQFVKVESSHVDTNMIQDIARMDPQDKEPTNLIQDIEKMGLQGKGATPPENPPNSTVLGSPQGQENPKASRSGRIIKKPKRFQEEEPEAPPKTKTGRRTHLGLLRAAILMILIFPISIPPSSANSIPVNLLCPPTFDALSQGIHVALFLFLTCASPALSVRIRQSTLCPAVDLNFANLVGLNNNLNSAIASWNGANLTKLHKQIGTWKKSPFFTLTGSSFSSIQRDCNKLKGNLIEVYSPPN